MNAHWCAHCVAHNASLKAGYSFKNAGLEVIFSQNDKLSYRIITSVQAISNKYIYTCIYVLYIYIASLSFFCFSNRLPHERQRGVRLALPILLPLLPPPDGGGEPPAVEVQEPLGGGGGRHGTEGGEEEGQEEQEATDLLCLLQGRTPWKAL